MWRCDSIHQPARRVIAVFIGVAVAQASCTSSRSAPREDQARAEPAPGEPAPGEPSQGEPAQGEPAQVEPARVGRQVTRAKITLLSTMLADDGIGEWGFAALIEAGGARILFDVGSFPDTVSRNARELGIDLTRVTDIVLSHHHGDHIGGLVSVVREARANSDTAMAEIHVARGMFAERRRSGKPDQVNRMVRLKPDIEALGARFVIHDKPAEIAPGVWVSGPVPRVHDERNWSGSRRIARGSGTIADNLPESQSLFVDTPRGLIVVSGCGHAGIINTLDHARKAIREAPIHAAIGGFHLFQASDDHLSWTARKLREFDTQHFVGAHCTGLEAVYQIRERAGLARATAVVGAVGATFSLTDGLKPGALAR